MKPFLHRFICEIKFQFYLFNLSVMEFLYRERQNLLHPYIYIFYNMKRNFMCPANILFMGCYQVNECQRNGNAKAYSSVSNVNQI